MQYKVLKDQCTSFPGGNEEGQKYIQWSQTCIVHRCRFDGVS